MSRLAALLALAALLLGAYGVGRRDGSLYGVAECRERVDAEDVVALRAAYATWRAEGGQP